MLLLIAGWVNSAQAQSAVRLATPEEIHEMLVRTIDVKHLSEGIVVGVITRKAREVIAYGKFDRDDPRVPDGKTLFEIGSISKVLTSLLLADMVVKGEVKLSDPVSKYLPSSIHVPTRNGKQITLLDLATHRSGLPNFPTNWHPGYTTEEYHQFLSHYKLTRDPGDQYEYSNQGAALLGDALARRAGTDYDTLLRDRITGPLQMNHTGVAVPPEMQANLTPGHNIRLEKSPPGADYSYAGGAGNIRSTVDDMLKFLAANMGLIDSPLKPAMKKMLSVRRPINPGLEMGLGWQIWTEPTDFVHHDGLTNGYASFVGFEPGRKVGVVVLSNTNVFLDLDVAVQILNHPATAPAEQNIGPANLPH